MHPLIKQTIPLALCLGLASVVPQARAEGYVPPTSSYDTPERVILPIDKGDEVHTHTLGEPRKNAWNRMVQTRLLGLDEVNRLTALQNASGKPQAEAAKSEDKASAAAGWVMGALFGSAGKAMAESKKEDLKDNLTVYLTETGSPDDKPGSAVADLYKPNNISGSIFGAKVGNKLKVRVVSSDFQPKILIMRKYLSNGRWAAMFGSESTNSKPAYKVSAEAGSDGSGSEKVIVTFDQSRESADPDTVKDIVFAVTSADGKATTGQYTIKFYNE